MPVQRDRPYCQFNFTVALGNSPTDGAIGGFQEVSGLGIEVTVAEYRAGNWKSNSSIKITGTYKVPDITLKRGLIGAPDLYTWLDAVRTGAQPIESQYRTVTINLLAEDHVTVVQTWKLTNARPIKYTGPALMGKGTDLAIEELVLSSELMDIS
jgi:phage tail-like protein